MQTSGAGFLSSCVSSRELGYAVFGRLNWEQISIDLAMELAELAEKDAAELRRLTTALVYELSSELGEA